jgi:hypothetical protein
VWETDGHIPRRWFRDTVLRPALATSGLEVDIRMQLLRHAHASWLLAGGADLQVVKDRLGHGSISTTERYLHTLPDADDTAVDAFARIRRRAPADNANPSAHALPPPLGWYQTTVCPVQRIVVSALTSTPAAGPSGDPTPG